MSLTDTDLSTIENLLVSLQSKLDDRDSRITDLQNQIVGLMQTQGMNSFLMKQLANLQSLSGWILAGGTAGNTGQTGSTGTAFFSPVKADGSVDYTIQPAGPYYDSFMYRIFSGAGASPSLQMPQLSLGYVIYRADFTLDATNLPLANAVELDSSWYYPQYRFQAAGQVQLASKTFRIYKPYAKINPDGTMAGDWIPTGIHVVVASGVPISIELLCKFDVPNGITNYEAVAVNGVYYPLGISVAARLKATENPFAHTSVQLDSNSQGQNFVANVKNVGIAWM